MFYIAFVTYENLEILEEVLNCLRERFSSTAWVQVKNERYQYTSNYWDESPFKENKYLVPQEWLLHGEIDSSLDDISTKPYLREFKSLVEVEKNFKYLSSHFHWSMFTWGGVGSLLSIGFISHDKEIFEYFLSKYVQIFHSMTLYKLKNVLMSRYVVSSKFTDSCCVLLLNLLGKNIGTRIWKACNCDENFPWLITNRDYSEMDEASIPCMKEINFFVEGDDSRQVRRRDLKVFEIQNLELFSRVCSESSLFSATTTIIIPSGTDLKAMQSVLEKTELYDLDNHDVQWIDHIKNQCNWFYGINRDYTDEQNSIFISKDSSLLMKIDSMSLNDGYKFISCF